MLSQIGVTENGEPIIKPVLIDFGISKPLVTHDSTSGTITHMSAETKNKTGEDERTELRALAMVIAESVLGRGLRSGTISEIFDKIDNEDGLEDYESFLKKAREIGIANPERFAKAINKALNKEQDDRYDTIRDFVTDLYDKEEIPSWYKAVEPRN